MTDAAYSEGLHLLLTLSVPGHGLLTDPDGFLKFTETLLEKYGLEEVGRASHSFDNGGFTAAVCLKESHLCIHTWPEFSRLTMDLYLCNYLRDNSEKVRALGDAFCGYFQAETLSRKEVWR